MSEYKHTVSKQGLSGLSQDPPQDSNNSQSPKGLETPLTVSNAVVIGVAAAYGKKVISTGARAIIGQLGNARLERSIRIGTKVIGYVGIGIASGPAAVFTVPLAIATDIAVKGINDLTESHSIALDNRLLVEERGTLLTLGAGGYYG